MLKNLVDILADRQDECPRPKYNFSKNLLVTIMITMSLNSDVLSKRNPFEFGAKIFEIECLSIGKFNNDYVALIKIEPQTYIVKQKSYINDYYITLVNKDGLKVKDKENNETFIKLKNPSTLK